MGAVTRFIGELLAALVMLLLVLLAAWGCLAVLDGIVGIVTVCV